MKEEFKLITEYPNYQVSNTGKIKNINSGRTLKTPPMAKGYSVVGLRKDGKTKVLRVHRIVYCTFNGIPFDTELVICHKDDVRDNNSLSNLFAGTHQDNIDDKVRKGRQSKGTEQHLATLDESKVRFIRKNLEEMSQSEIARILGVTQGCVWQVATSRTWKHI